MENAISATEISPTGESVVDIFNQILDEGITQDVVARMEKWYEEQEKDVVEVVSVHPLTDAQKEELEKKLISLYGRSFELKNTLDAKILGGLKIKIGSHMIDASVSGQLDKMKATLESSL